MFISEFYHKSLQFFSDPYGYVKKNPESYFRILLIPIGWLFQGLLYSDKTERFFKILLDIILIAIFLLLLRNLFTLWIAIIVAFIIAHTLNWMFNVGFWCTFRGKYGMKIKGVGIKNCEEYINNLKNKGKKEKSILAIAIFGSYSRGEEKDTSDIDIRIIRKPGMINGIRACLFGFSEKIYAFLKKIPLDLYILDNITNLSKMRENEIPLIVYDPYKALTKIYQT